nr:hypothetical protein [Tanacetum cinerariifolium]
KSTPRDLTQALNYFEQASLQGHAQAQYQLGLMFFRGEGVQANNIQAYIVLKMAAVNGSEDALDQADEVSEQMKKEDLEVATQERGLSRDLPGTGSNPCEYGVSGTTESSDFATAAR